MRITIAPNRAVELVQGDITREKVDAIVNAANADLLPGGGVCGAIHRAGGPEIAEECRRIRQEKGPVRTGAAVATTGGKISRYVIHAVGPVWQGGRQGESEALGGCYRQSLRIADELKLQSIAFPAISTGIFGYPVAEAAGIALQAVAGSLPALKHVERVRFVLFDQSTFDTFIAAARHLPAASQDR